MNGGPRIAPIYKEASSQASWAAGREWGAAEKTPDRAEPKAISDRSKVNPMAQTMDTNSGPGLLPRDPVSPGRDIAAAGPAGSWEAGVMLELAGCNAAVGGCIIRVAENAQA